MPLKNLIGALANGGAGSSDVDLAQSIIDSPRMSEILGRYGLSEPQRLDDSIIPVADDSMLGRHPMVRGMLENALLGFANTAPSRTPGEAVSNIARGVLSVPQARTQAMMSRVMAPLQTAKMLGDLDESAAHAEYYRQGGRSMKTAQDVWTNVKPTEDGRNMIMVNNHSGEIKVVPVPDGHSVATKTTHESMVDLYRHAAGTHPDQKGLLGADLEADIAGAKAALGVGANYGATIAGYGANARINADRAHGGLSDAQTAGLRSYDEAIDSTQKEYDQIFKMQKPSEIDANFTGANYMAKKQARQAKLNEIKAKLDEVKGKKNAYAKSIGVNVDVPPPSPAAPPRATPPLAPPSDSKNPFRH